MKKIIVSSLIIFLISCKKETAIITEIPKESSNNNPTELGKELFEGKGMCATCHHTENKIVGPSIKEIAKIYTTQKASISIFLQGEADPIVDPSQYEIMKSNFTITKAMTEEELKAIEKYMHSIK